MPGSQQIDAVPMAANLSQRHLQSMVLAFPMTDFATWRMIVNCRGSCACWVRLADCGRCPASAVPVSRLPLGTTFAAVLRRLRCARCGSRADRVFLDNDTLDWRRRVFRVWGRGSYA